MSIPFSAYDFFGYLAAGFLVLCSVERAVGGDWIINQDLKAGRAGFWLFAAYVTGHIVANLSSFFIEHKFVRGLLGSPEDLLFTAEPAPAAPIPWMDRLRSWRWWVGWINPVAWWVWVFPFGWKRGLFPIYYEPLPAETQQRTLAKSTPLGFAHPGRGLFNHCHTIAKRDKTAYDRMTAFLNLYGFCRNVCMGALIAILILVGGAYLKVTPAGWQLVGPPRTELLWWAVAAGVVALGMLYRYLKFFRHYTNEVFVTYSEPTEPTKPSSKVPQMPGVHVLNVNDGECTVIQHGSGQVTVIDVSAVGKGAGPGAQAAVP